VRALLCLRDCGWGIRRLAKHFGISLAQTHRIATGMLRQQPSRVNVAVAKRIVRLRAQGETISGIARMLNLGRWVVRRLLSNAEET
jgi:hypothetical protein